MVSPEIRKSRETDPMTPEERLIERYFDTFNRHDIEAVMACFHGHPTIVGADGRRREGREAVRRQYEGEFAAIPDGHCELRMCTGNTGRGVAESLFHGTRASDGKVIEANGAELMEIVDGKIKEIRDYHRPASAQAAQQGQAAVAGVRRTC
jgi:ketosteroid isomerase-like protein